MRLLRNTSNGAIVEWTPERHGNTKYVELTEDEVYGFRGQVAVKGPRKLDPNEGIMLYTTSMGIGDAITVLYAACGLANAGYKVTYNTRHYHWIEWVVQNNLTLKPLAPLEQVAGVDVNQDYQDQLWESYIGRLKSRPHWALRAIRMAYPSLPENIEPSPPEAVIKPDPIVDDSVIVISPFASSVGPSRNWPSANYSMLIHKLTQAGQRVVTTITSEHRDATPLFEMAGAKVWIDAVPSKVVRLVANAKAVIGNDSGICHLGGLYQVPTFSIMAIVPPGITFWCSSVQGIVPHPRINCRFCCWQKEGGLIPACGTFCGAIATITPDDVLTDVLFQVGEKSNIPPSIRSQDACL